MKLIGRVALGPDEEWIVRRGVSYPSGTPYLGVQSQDRGKLVAFCGFGGQGRHSGKVGTTELLRVGEIRLDEEGPKVGGV